jgi:lambda repressor-like predicted transcriptional regulator
MTILPMHNEDVKATIRKKFGSVKAFEAANGLPRGSVYEVFRNRRWAKVEKAINDVIGYPSQELSEKTDSKLEANAHRLNAKAA